MLPLASLFRDCAAQLARFPHRFNESLSTLRDDGFGDSQCRDHSEDSLRHVCLGCNGRVLRAQSVSLVGYVLISTEEVWGPYLWTRLLTFSRVALPTIQSRLDPRVQGLLARSKLAQQSPECKSCWLKHQGLHDSYRTRSLESDGCKHTGVAEEVRAAPLGSLFRDHGASITKLVMPCKFTFQSGHCKVSGICLPSFRSLSACLCCLRDYSSGKKQSVSDYLATL